MKGRVQILWVLIMAGVFLLVTLAAAQAFTLTATLSANPPSYSGNCPGTITFNGKITLSSPSPLKSPVEVKYRFKRSDGATDTNVKTLTFTQPGSQDVSTTWTLGGAALPDYCGWESVEIISPQSVNSNQASFVLICSNVQWPSFQITDMFAIPKGNGVCDIGFKVKNMGGGAISSNFGACIGPGYYFYGLFSSGNLTLLDFNEPLKNSKTAGGEDTFTLSTMSSFWPNVQSSLTLKLSPMWQGNKIGNDFSLTKVLKCP